MTHDRTVPFTSGEHGYHTFRIPALTQTPDGTLVALAEGRRNNAKDEGDIDIVCRRSEDSGTTWGPLIVVADNGCDTIGNPTIVTDPASGDLVLLSCTNGAEDNWQKIVKGEAPPRRVWVQRSTDQALTWSQPQEITDQVRKDNWLWYATGPGHGIALTDGEHAGRLIIPCNHTATPDGKDTGKFSGGHAILSDDGGHTWRIGFVASGYDGRVNENEATCCLTSEDLVYFNCRCSTSDKAPGTRVDAYSTDGGETLVKDYHAQATIEMPACQGSVIRLTSGALMFSGPSHSTERAAMGLWGSVDDGVTWKLKQQLSGLPAAYSSLVELDPLTVGVLYETGDYAPYSRIQFERVGPGLFS